MAVEHQAVFVRDGFDWRAADAYLFDIDGTLLNSRDAVHYFAFHHALQEIWQTDARIDGLPVHGNTDIGILRAAAQRVGISEERFRETLPEICARMSAEVSRNAAGLRPEVCAAIPELMKSLYDAGKVLGVATGNLEAIGWAKLEACGLRQYFHFGAFSSVERELRSEIFAWGVRQARERKPGARVIVVGDTPSDIHAARAIGVAVLSVATGTYSYAQLRELEPDMLVDCCSSLEIGRG